MSKKKTVDWIGFPEALEIIEKNSGRTINRKYLYLLAKNGKLARKPIDGRSYLYSKQDAETISVVSRGKKHDNHSNA